MANGNDRYDALMVFDASDNAIITDPVAPKAGHDSFQSLTTLARVIESWQFINNEI